MTYAEADLVPLSALQHYMHCPRQCALIHVEQVWVESGLTAEGRILHDRVDAGGAEKRRDVKRAFGLPIRCLRLGLVGKADVVEFHRQAGGRWLPYPVEHKRGRRKREDWDRVQLCAQALCLEEMLAVPVPEGALFYGKEQRREVVALDESRTGNTGWSTSGPSRRWTRRGPLSCSANRKRTGGAGWVRAAKSRRQGAGFRFPHHAAMYPPHSKRPVRAAYAETVVVTGI